jgi:hypothetical protein
VKDHREQITPDEWVLVGNFVGGVTPEQVKQVEEIQARQKERAEDLRADLFDVHDGLEAHRDVSPLLAIVDDLRKQLAKQDEEIRTTRATFQTATELVQLRDTKIQILQKQLNTAILIGQAAVSLTTDQLPQAKQYTEAELRAEFESYALKRYENYGAQIIQGKFYSNGLTEQEYLGWLACARFLGVLKYSKTD